MGWAAQRNYLPAPTPSSSSNPPVVSPADGQNGPPGPPKSPRTGSGSGRVLSWSGGMLTRRLLRISLLLVLVCLGGCDGESISRQDRTSSEGVLSAPSDDDAVVVGLKRPSRRYTTLSVVPLCVETKTPVEIKSVVPVDAHGDARISDFNLFDSFGVVGEGVIGDRLRDTSYGSPEKQIVDFRCGQSGSLRPYLAIEVELSGPGAETAGFRSLRVEYVDEFSSRPRSSEYDFGVVFCPGETGGGCAAPRG